MTDMAKQYTQIKHMSTYLPEAVESNEDIAVQCGRTDVEALQDEYGITFRHRAAHNETALDMAVKAGRLVLDQEHGSKPDFILYCTQSPEYYLPSGACIIQHRLGLPDTIGALDINLGGSGFIYGLSMADGLLQSGTAHRILFITADTMSRHVYPRDCIGRALFGDAAAAALICLSETPGLHAVATGTDGTGYRAVMVPRGGMRQRFDPGRPEVPVPGGDSIRTDNHLFLDRDAVNRAAEKRISSLIASVLMDSGLSADDIACVMINQCSRNVVRWVCNHTGIDRKKLYADMSMYGDTGSSYFALGLETLFKDKRVPAGTPVLLCGFGPGFSWGGALITF